MTVSEAKYLTYSNVCWKSKEKLIQNFLKINNYYMNWFWNL